MKRFFFKFFLKTIQYYDNRLHKIVLKSFESIIAIKTIIVLKFFIKRLSFENLIYNDYRLFKSIIESVNKLFYI